MTAITTTLAKFQIEQISYDLILKLSNLEPKQKNVLVGNLNRYIAIRKNNSGIEAIFETLGYRDECANLLKKMLNEPQFA